MFVDFYSLLMDSKVTLNPQTTRIHVEMTRWHWEQPQGAWLLWAHYITIVTLLLSYTPFLWSIYRLYIHCLLIISSLLIVLMRLK